MTCEHVRTPRSHTLRSACQAARAARRNPYPHKFHTTMLLPAYVAAYGALQAGEQRADETVAIAGERMSPATQSRKGSAHRECEEPCVQLLATVSTWRTCGTLPDGVSSLHGHAVGWFAH